VTALLGFLETGGLHPHLVLEGLAYLASLTLLLLRHRRDRLPDAHRFPLLLAGLLGAVLGSKMLGWLQHAPLLGEPGSLQHWLGGKTLVGGLLGGWGAIAFYKRRHAIVGRTGDAFVPSLWLGTVIGRLGCFLTGLEDDTVGLHTSVPWAVDFGDGPRHPAQLYEVAFVVVLAGLLQVAQPWLRHFRGLTFQLYLAGYLCFRLVIDAFKPMQWSMAGLSPIQWAAALGLAFCLREMHQILTIEPAAAAPTTP
jgi:phosphatidylglycerol:prolipoprotein diacylglycerol transferase